MTHTFARHTPLAAVDRIDREPTAEELEAIDEEMPALEAEDELLHAQIICMDRTPSQMDARRIRRARHRVLAARRSLANHSRMGGAA